MMTLWAILIFVHHVSGIGPPGFISGWMPIEAHGSPSEVEIEVPHTLSELPQKVEVQIRVTHNSTYFYFNALNSAQTGSQSDEYGGVVFMFDETKVKIIAPGPAGCSACNGYIVFLGGPDFDGPVEFPRTFKSGHVRVRAWRMCEFGRPSFIQSVLINNQWPYSFGEVAHDMSKVELLIVHVYLNNGYIVHGEGSAAGPLTSNYPFGGLVFAYSNTNIRYWSLGAGGIGTSEGVPFSVMNGWGVTGDVYNETEVEAQMFAYKFMDFTPNPRLFSLEINKGTGSQDLPSFDVTNYLDVDDVFTYLTMSPEVNVENFGYKFQVPGSSMASGINATEHYGSLVYGYSKQSIYLWRPPDDGFGCIFAIGGQWGSGEHTECSTLVTVNAVGVGTDTVEDVCEGKGCSATKVGPLCDCGGSGFEGQFCTSPISCPPPTGHNSSIVTYSPYSSSYGFQQNVIFSCVPGYQQFNGSSIRNCTHNKTWSDEPMHCERITCTDPEVPDPKSSIIHNTSLKFEGVITYKCDPGFGVVTGDQYRTCLADATWSGEPITCNVSCGYPSTAGGVYRTTWGDTIGKYANYTCRIGYENATGSMSRYCEADATWTGVPPSCSIKYCEAPVDGHNSNLTYTTLYYGSKAYYTCPVGHVSTVDKTSTAITARCQDDKTWSHAPLNCTRIECQLPSVGSYVGNFPITTYVYEDVITHECVTGYILGSGNLVRTCLSNGQWSGVQPSCKDIECPQLGNITKGQIVTTGIIYGSQAVAVCEDGAAVMSGDMVRMCSLNGTWFGNSGDEPVCEEIRYISFKIGDYSYNDNNVSSYVLDYKSLSKYRRSLRSPFYNYPSHIALGTFGILILVGVCSYICSLDLINLTSRCKNELLRSKKNMPRKKVYKVYITRK